MEAIVAAVVAVLLSALLFRVLSKQKRMGVAMSGAGHAQRTALGLALAGLILIVVGWAGVSQLEWATWLVWTAVIVYVISTIIRAIQRIG